MDDASLVRKLCHFLRSSMKEGVTIVMITHDRAIADQAQRRIRNFRWRDSFIIQREGAWIDEKSTFNNWRFVAFIRFDWWRSLCLSATEVAAQRLRYEPVAYISTSWWGDVNESDGYVTSDMTQEVMLQDRQGNQRGTGSEKDNKYR